MAVKPIVKLGDPVLRKKCKPVESINKKIIQLLDNMIDTMYKSDGVGLAAPQVGVLKRIAIVDIGLGLIELINPEIIEYQGEQKGLEACLSIPGEKGCVMRPYYVKVKALNRKGEAFELDAIGYLAVALCHEIDHLDGILFIDKLTKTK